MAANFGFDSYRRYKAGTAKFASWFAEVGRIAGADVNQMAVPAPSSAKQPSNKAVYTIAVRNFVPLAERTATKVPAIIVPRSMLDLLGEVISLRKEVSEMAKGSSKAEHDGHIYFIRVLESVHKILTPLQEKQAASTDISSESNSGGHLLSNDFEALDIEEPSHNEPTIHEEVPKHAPKQPKKTYDIEAELDDVLLPSLLFFSDLKKTREHIKELWGDYKRGLLDLATASTVTTTAMSIMTATLQDLRYSMEGWPKDAPNEQEWLYWAYSYLYNGQNTSQKNRKRTFDLEQVVDELGYNTLEHVCLQPFEYIRRLRGTVTDAENGSSGTVRLLQCHDRELGYSASSSERFQNDELFLQQYLAYVHNATAFQMHTNGWADVLTEALFESKVRDDTLWLSFSLQRVLDIRHVLQGYESIAFWELQATANRANEVTREYLQSRPKKQSDEEHKTFDQRGAELLQLVRLNASMVLHDPVAEEAKKRRLLREKNLGFIDPRPFCLLKYNPFTCGAIIYKLNAKLMTLGTFYDPRRETIVATLHLYNAVKQTKILKTVWPDMEYLITLHTPEHLFFGLVWFGLVVIYIRGGG